MVPKSKQVSQDIINDAAMSDPGDSVIIPGTDRVVRFDEEITGLLFDDWFYNQGRTDFVNWLANREI